MNLGIEWISYEGKTSFENTTVSDQWQDIQWNDIFITKSLPKVKVQEYLFLQMLLLFVWKLLYGT